MLTTGRPFVIWARGQPPDEEALGLTIKEKFTVEQPYRPPISRLCALKTIDIESCEEVIILEKGPTCGRRGVGAQSDGGYSRIVRAQQHTNRTVSAPTQAANRR